jgi:hypothetical protein
MNLDSTDSQEQEQPLVQIQEPVLEKKPVVPEKKPVVPEKKPVQEKKPVHVPVPEKKPEPEPVVPEKKQEPVQEQTSPELVTLLEVSKDTFIEQITLQIIEQIKGQDLDKSRLFSLLVTTMEIVENSTFKGTEQKDIVIQILRAALESDIVKSPHKADLILFLNNDATDIIDIIVSASKGKFDINTIETMTSRFFTCLFRCLKKNKQNKI